MLRTRICDELGIEYPIFGAGMRDVTLAALVAAVSNAGGLGVLGGSGVPPETLRAEIRKVRGLTSKPFGVDLIVPAGLPPDANQVQPPPLPPFLEELRRSVESFPEPPEPWVLTEELARQQFEVIVEERVPLYASGLGTPEWMVAEAHANGMKVMSLVGNVRSAVRVEELGVDYIVAQGHEAGGHTGRIGTMVLVPAVVDAVKVPVVAAGGIADGRGLAAALMLGAVGAWIGTRFIATTEAITPTRVKEKIVEVGEEDTVVTRAYTGKTTRVIRNRYTDLWQGNDRYLQKMPWQGFMVEPIVGRARVAENLDIPNWPAGQVVGLIHEIKSAGELVAEIVKQASRLLGENREAKRVGEYTRESTL